MGRKVKEKHECSCGENRPEYFYIGRKSKCKICDAERAKNRYRGLSNEDKLNYIKNQTKWIGDNIIKVRVLAAKHRAIRKNLVFEINENFINELLIQQNGKCFYSGVILDLTGIGGNGNQMNLNTLSIDRFDSNIGYVKSNIVLVTAIVNSMKNDLSNDAFINTIDLICQFNKRLKN
jgi:hypothetical protein